MSRQFWSETVSWATADGTAVANTTTETIVFPNVTIPANYMQDGRVLRVRAFGRYGNVVTSVPTLTFKLRWGGVAGTVIGQSPAIKTSPTAVTSAPWSLEAFIQTRSNGSTGTVFVMGDVVMTVGSAPSIQTVGGTTSLVDPGMTALISSTGTTIPAAVTVDLTADTALSLTAVWSAANASNTMTGHIYTIETLN